MHSATLDAKGSQTAEDVTVPLLTTSSARNQPRKRPLSLLPLIALMFYNVSGGPFGTEDAVSAGGPLLTVLGFIVFPIIWSIPEALITAELATAFPENSGYVVWVTAAFGPFWGFLEGFWSWLSGVTDNSIYPVMFVANLKFFLPVVASGWPRMVFLVSFSMVLSFLNYLGLTVVGGTAVTTTFFILVPFILMSLLAIPKVHVSNWLVMKDLAQVDWGKFINVMFWNLNYWDNVSTLAGEVDTPHKTFPRALFCAIVVVVASYLFPLLAGLGVMPNADNWELGYYNEVAQMVSGKWLAVWILMAAAASQVGQYQAEMSSDSFQIHGMAERGFLPKVLGRKSRFGTPTIAIILSSLGILCLAAFDFVAIVELLNAIYALAELLEFAAFIWLRIKAPDMHRPYRVPLPVWALVVMLLPASIFLLAIIGLPFYKRDWIMVGWTVGAFLAAFVLYHLLNVARERQWCEFEPLHFDLHNPLLEGHSFSRRGSLDVSRRGSLDVPVTTPLLQNGHQHDHTNGHLTSIDEEDGIATNEVSTSPQQ